MTVAPPSNLPKLQLPTPDSSGLKLVPAPPSPGGKVEQGELRLMHEVAKGRTPEGDEWARWLDHEGQRAVWFDLAKRYRQKHGFIDGWRGTALLAATLAATAGRSLQVKERYDRKRPYIADPSLPHLFNERTDSYPSGHASTAFAAARVFSELDADIGRDAYALAEQVALSRVYAGVHFPSDVEIGAALGTGVADRMLKRFRIDPSAFDPRFA
jgi:membrane-associated phospholipid phosphatase